MRRRSTGSAGLQLSRSKLAQMIDISAVQAFHTEEDVRNLAGLALEGLALEQTVHRRSCAASLRAPAQVAYSGRVAQRSLARPIGFPSGGHTTTIKVAEARSLVEAGADELDHDDQSWRFEVWRP